MGKLKNPVIILGEGPTEFYYFNSLKDVIKNINVKPDYPKHSDLHALERNIEKCIDEGYAKIYCVIDMDNKDIPEEKQKYEKLKRRYAKPIIKPRKGINCVVEFFETHRCTELFFLYYFAYTSKCYTTQEKIIKDINKHCVYEKKQEFFKKCRGLHSFFEKHNGDLNLAIANANKSCRERDETGRQHSYSELGLLIEKLQNHRD